MTIITVFSNSFCQGTKVAEQVSRRLDCPLVTDASLTAGAGGPLSQERLLRALTRPPTLFNNFTRESERGVAICRAALAERVRRAPLVYHGFAAHLLPWYLTDVLRVGLVAPERRRVERARARHGWTERRARRLLRADDRHADLWTTKRFGVTSQDPRLYDLVLSLDHAATAEAAERIVVEGRRPAHEATAESQALQAEFLLEARVEAALVEAGHDVEVRCRGGDVSLWAHEYLLLPKRQLAKLEQRALQIPGVTSATARMAPRYQRPNLLIDLEVGATRVLLLHEDGQTTARLTSALQGPSVLLSSARNLRQARALLALEEPDVLVLGRDSVPAEAHAFVRELAQAHPSVAIITLVDHDAPDDSPRAIPGVFAQLRASVQPSELTEIVKSAGRRPTGTSNDPRWHPNMEETAL